MNDSIRLPVTTARPWSRRFAAGALLFALLPAACASSDVRNKSEPVKPSASLLGNYLAGRHAQVERDMEAAVEFLKAALAKDPDNPDLVKRAFVLFLAEGRMKEALDLARRAAKIQDSTPFAGIALAIHDIKQKKYAAAFERADALPDTGINTLLAPLLKSWAKVGLGKPDEALESLARLARHNGAQALYDFHAALVNESAGRIEAARTHYLKVADSQVGLSLRLVQLLGGLYERSGNRDDAKALYAKFRERNPDSRLLEPALKRVESGGKAPPAEVSNASDGIAEGLFGVASSLRQQNARETALLLGRLGLYLKPDYAAMQILVADILENDRRPAAANQVYAQINAKSPFTWPARIRVAVNLDRLDRTDEAAAKLRAMAAEDKTQAEPLITLGDILRGRKRFAEAVKAYDDGIQRVAKIERQHWSLLYSRGIALERSNQWPRAEADFLKALEFEPDQPYVLNYLGYSWVEKRKNLEQAFDMIKKAVSLRPNDGYIVDSLGWAHYQLGAYADAVRELERAVELRPEDPVITDHLGDALWMVGRRHEARFQWERALGLKPEPEVVEDIKKKLKEGLAQKPKAPGNG
jgi:tetratricopeptide (TPR) repeat protein